MYAFDGEKWEKVGSIPFIGRYYYDQYNTPILYEPVTTVKNGFVFMGASADGDGKVDNRDAMILDRYIAGWEGYDSYIVNMIAADMNQDGEVTNRDAIIIDRYVAGWDGYDKYTVYVPIAT